MSRKDVATSLTVPADLLDQARHGEVDDDAFTACIQASLPYAWQLIGDLTQQLHATGADRADNRVPPPDEAARGQLLLGRTAVPASLPENHQSELSPRGRQGAVSPVSGMGEVDHHPVRAGQR